MDPWLRPWWARAIALGALAVALTTYAWWPMLAAYPHTMNGDGQAYHKILEAGRVSILRYHEFPHWNPYECGGYPLWDNPQAWAGAPLTWFSFIVGTTRTIEGWIIVHVAMGFVCMWLFARHELGLDRIATFVAAGAWTYSGFHQHHYSGGHLTFVPVVYFPLALLLWRRAEVNHRCAVGLGVLLAWMFYEGGVYPLPHLVVLLGAETLTRAWPPRRTRRIALAGAIACLVAFTLAGSRLLPVLDQLQQHKRNMPEDVDAMHWSTLKEMFLSRAHGRPVPGQQYVWTEYGTYFGPILLALAVVGLFAAGLEGAWMAALLAFAALLMCGQFATWAPWTILHRHVPPFKEMRVPSRFRASVSMFLAAFAGIAVHRISRALSKHGPSRSWSDAVQVTLVCVALLGVGDVVSVGLDVIAPFFGMPPERPVAASTRFYYGGPGVEAFVDQPRQNRGEISCWDEWGFGQGSHLWEGDVPQARAVADAVTVVVANRTQNTFTIDVDAKRPGRVLLNTVYDDDWKTDLGTTVNVDNQLAIDLPLAGRFKLHVRCWPRTFDVGCVLTVLGFAGTTAFFLRDHRRRRWSA